MPAKKGHRSAAPKRVTKGRSAAARGRSKLSATSATRAKARPLRSPARVAVAATPAPRPDEPRFVEVTPSLAVRDVGRSLAFYHRLGFRLAAQLPPTGRAEWVRLERDQVAILVWNEVIASPDVLAALTLSRGAGNAVRITVSDVDRLAREFQESGIVLRHQPETMPQGVREFSILDPDGFILEFVTRLPLPAPSGQTSLTGQRS